jgi:hypothetical protein
MGHTNDGRGNRVYNNIFHRVGRAAIEFTNEHNESDGNVFSLMPGGGGFLRVLRPEPQQWLDLGFWREQFGWEKNGRMLNMEVAFDPDKLELTMALKGDLPATGVFHGINTDMFGSKTGVTRPPGPFADMGLGYKARKVDPRLSGDAGQ